MKKINAVEILRSIRDKQSKETSDKSYKEIINYFRRKARKIVKQHQAPEVNKR